MLNNMEITLLICLGLSYVITEYSTSLLPLLETVSILHIKFKKPQLKEM
jgi:hypothetical protein